MDLLVSQFDTLYTEMYKSFKESNPTSFEYIEKIQDMGLFNIASIQTMKYLKSKDDIKKQRSLAFTIIENIYYLSNDHYNKTMKAVSQRYQELNKDFKYQEIDMQEFVQELCTLIYRS